MKIGLVLRPLRAAIKCHHQVKDQVKWAFTVEIVCCGYHQLFAQQIPMLQNTDVTVQRTISGFYAAPLGKKLHENTGITRPYGSGGNVPICLYLRAFVKNSFPEFVKTYRIVDSAVRQCMSHR